MLPMHGAWSQLMMHRLSTMCPTIGGMWQPSLRWAFIQIFHLFKTSFPYSIPQFRIENLVIWCTITSLALWIIWKARCDVIFCNAHIHLRIMLTEFRLLFVHTHVVNMMICKVQLMFYGNVKWPLRNNGKGFTYFQIQLLV